MLKPGATLDLKAGDHVTVFQERRNAALRWSGAVPAATAVTGRPHGAGFAHQPVATGRLEPDRGRSGFRRRLQHPVRRSRAARRVCGRSTWRGPGAFCHRAGSGRLSCGGPSVKPAKTVITRVSDNKSIGRCDVGRRTPRSPDWPANLPTANGESYLISTAGRRGRRRDLAFGPRAPTGDWADLRHRTLQRRLHRPTRHAQGRGRCRSS